MKKTFTPLLALLFCSTVLGQQLLKDITPFNASSEVSNSFIFNNKLYFTAFSDQTNSSKNTDGYNNDSKYYELWNSDGSEAGTHRLMTQSPIGNGPYDPYNIFKLGTKLYYTAQSNQSYAFYITEVTDNQTVKNAIFSHAQMLGDVAGTVLFFGSTNTYGLELWKTDGTLAGTVLVKDITAGSGSSYPSSFITTSNLYYFVLYTAANGNELWRSDGTQAGTYMVRDIAGGTASANPQQITVMNNEVYFTANDGINGTELWKTDGTEAGTVMVKDINAGSASANPQELAVINNVLYFSADNGSNGTEVWTSAGTAATTSLFKDIYAGLGSSSPKKFTVSGPFIYFVATDAGSGTELWKTDGTAIGTALVKDIRAGDSFDFYSTVSPVGNYKNPLYDVNGTLFFFTFNGSTYARQLWKTDGTGANTVKIADITLTDWLLVRPEFEKLFITPTHLYYASGDGSGGYDIWMTDGTPNNAQLLRNISPTNAFTRGRPLITFNNEFYFAAFDPNRGYELFKTNGSGSGTLLVKDINTAPASSKPVAFLELNGEAYFIANDVQSGPNLFKSDGTSNGTVLLGNFGNIYTATAYGPFSYINNTSLIGLAATNGAVYLSQNRNKIWKTNGINSPAIIAGPGRGSSSGDISKNFTAVIENNVYFLGDFGGTSSFELWKSDGIITGLVKDINPSGASFPEYLTNVNGTLYFTASTSAEGYELWKSDGTNAGTILVKDIVSGSSGSSPQNLINVNGTLYFTASTSAQGRELWKSDGTNAGTILVKDLTSGSNSSYLSGLVAFGNRLIFYNQTNSSLYISDGTEAGTTALTNNVNAVNPIPVDNFIYFSKNGSLWKTDGTVAGTSQVASFIRIDNLTNINGILYFLGKNAANGEELWRSDGTSGGTVLVADMNVGAADSSPGGMTLINGKVYFSAYTPQYGREPWVIDHCPRYYDFVSGVSNITQRSINYESSVNITANNKIIPTATVIYGAGKQIELLPGFSAQTGVVFTAEINGCGSLQSLQAAIPGKNQLNTGNNYSALTLADVPAEITPPLETFFNQPDGSLHRRRFTETQWLLPWSITKTADNAEGKTFLLEYKFEGQSYTSALTLP